MKDEKVKINMRVGQRLREVLEGRAAVEDIRVGTLTNRLLQEELGKVLAVGAEHCVVEGEDEYEQHREEIAKIGINIIFFLPMLQLMTICPPKRTTPCSRKSRSTLRRSSTR